MSDWFTLLLLIIATCAVIFVIVQLRHRRATVQDQAADPSETPDVIEYMTMMVGVVYAIVLGLAIAGVWEERGAAEEWVRQEAQALHELGERAQAFPAASQEGVRESVEAYVGYTVDEEWPYMIDNEGLSEEGDLLFAAVRQSVAALEPFTAPESYAYEGMHHQLATASEARTSRGMSAESTLPGVVWLGLITGAAVVVGMLFALQIRRTGRELLLAGLFSALIVFLLYLIWHFDAPFARGLSDSTEAFRTLFPHVLPDE
ncbi:bestrophin-like domain [Streptomyces xiamenensis]